MKPSLHRMFWETLGSVFIIVLIYLVASHR